ncbi:MAG TPA: aldo/keto reductase [Burkholderiales bacterium]|nr:aldo/keto reductase [Burkholderiales bacterium]
MKQRRLGKSGLQVSVVGLGCNNFAWRTDLAASRRVIDRAIDCGITLFDTADVYGNFGGSEEHIGQCLGERRNGIVLATKFSVPMDPSIKRKDASRRYIMTAVEASLRRLKTHWIDLYQLHRPDDSTPIEETLRALDDLVRQGKVRYIGCSNLPAWQVVDARWTSIHLGLGAFVSCQDEYNVLARGAERELIPAMRACGIGMLPYYPLASGLLSGKYRRDAPLPPDGRITNGQRYIDQHLTDSNWRKVDRLREFCAQRGHSLLELAFSWLAAQPVMASIIAGATRPEQVEQNARAADWALGAEDLAEIDRLTLAE